MATPDRYCHTATISVTASTRTAFDFMADGVAGGRWALGSWDRRKVGDNLFVGTSLYDGKEIYIRVEPDADTLIILYGAGTDPEDLPLRTQVRIVAGQIVGGHTQTCLITLMSWRVEGMNDDRWNRLCVSHETEMYMIKGMIEGAV